MIVRTLLAAALVSCSVPADDAPAEPRNSSQNDPNSLVTVELATVGVDMHSRTPVVLLREAETGQSVPILVGVAEAEAIARSLHDVVMPRPMTHDLMAAVLGELNAEVEEVVVSEVRNGTFIGVLRVRVAGEDATRDVDSRPSDAMALALRTGAPIRVARQIMDEAPDIDFMAPDGDQQVVRALGISVRAPNPELREEFDLPDRDGVIAVDVSATAAEAGVQRGDLIVDVEGRTPVDPMDFFDAVQSAGSSDRVRMVLWRDGEERTIDISRDVPPSPRQERQRRTVAT